MLSFASRTKVSSGASRARVIRSFWPLFCVVGRWMQDCRNPESRSCGYGTRGLAVRSPAAVPTCEELRELIRAALRCSRAPRSPAQVTPDSSQRSRARQRSSSRGQEVVWQGGGPVCRGHDQGWREHGCLPGKEKPVTCIRRPRRTSYTGFGLFSTTLPGDL